MWALWDSIPYCAFASLIDAQRGPTQGVLALSPKSIVTPTKKQQRSGTRSMWALWDSNPQPAD